MPTLIKRSNGIFYQVSYQTGRRIWRSTGVRTKPLALRAIEDGLDRSKPKRSITMAQFSAEFLDHARTNFAPTTVELYERAIKNFVRLVGDKPLRNYTSLDAERFKTLRAKEVSPVTLNIAFRSVKSFFQTAVRWNLIDKNPLCGVKQVKIPFQRPVYLSKDEFQRLMQVIHLPWLKNLSRFALSTMMRAGEIVNLRWDSIDLGRRLILVENTDTFRTKTTKPRSIPMNDWVFKFLSSKTMKTGYVFTLPCGRKILVRHASRMFKRAVRTAGLSDDIHLHSLRHTGASWLVQDGASIYAVQRILGHSSIQVTMGYSHLVSHELHGVINRIQVAAN